MWLHPKSPAGRIEAPDPFSQIEQSAGQSLPNVGE
jgi:hypothetical protein